MLEAVGSPHPEDWHRVTHQGDSTNYIRLATLAMDKKITKEQIDAEYTTERITQEQWSRLYDLLSE